MIRKMKHDRISAITDMFFFPRLFFTMMSLFNKFVDVNKYFKIGITAEAISFRGVACGWTGCIMTRGSFHKAFLLNNLKTIVNPVDLTK